MFRKMLMFGGLAMLGLTVVVGWPAIASYAAAAKEMAGTAIEESVPFEVQIRRLQGMVDDLDRVVVENERRLIEQQVDAEYLGREITERETELDAARAGLESLRTRLVIGPVPVSADGETIPRERLEREAVRRAQAYRAARDTLAARRETHGIFEEAIAVSRAQIEQARTRRAEYADAIDRLRADNVRLQAKRELAATIERIQPADARGEFAETNRLFDRMRKRLEVENRVLDRRVGSLTAGISWTEPVSPVDVLGEIDAALGDGTGDLPGAFPGGEYEVGSQR